MSLAQMAIAAAKGAVSRQQTVLCSDAEILLGEIERLRARDADLRATLRAVLHLYGPEGAEKVTTLALKARNQEAAQSAE